MKHYNNSCFGFGSILMVHGSAAYKTVIPALVSVLILLTFSWTGVDNGTRYFFQHPYAIGAMISFIGLMLTFRLNFCYARYWEGATVTHQMLSKWMDFALITAAFHYQSNQFDDIKPPTFGAHPDANQDNTTGRERVFKQMGMEAHIKSIQLAAEKAQAMEHTPPKWYTKPFSNKTKHRDLSLRDYEKFANLETKKISKSSDSAGMADDRATESDANIPIPRRFQERFAAKLEDDDDDVDSDRPKRGRLMRSKTEARRRLIRPKDRIPTPSLFLQEMAHLVSLLTAVAMSSLRNDAEGAEPPMVEYIPGKPWPPTDPDNLPLQDTAMDNAFYRAMVFVLGTSRSERSRTLYNAARPFQVLGGVSDEEVFLLQRARGPKAKVSLCMIWLKEFLSREYLSGSTGKVHGPILSRLYQIISDGNLGYNQAVKIAKVPFPFPHAQITAFFTVAIIVFFPILYYSYVKKLWLSCVMNLFSVVCFLGLHEVARELENPFTHVPNDLPLTTYQAQFNEALVTIYAGYNPNSWWEYTKSARSSKWAIDEEEEEGEKTEDEKSSTDLLGQLSSATATMTETLASACTGK